MNYKKIMSLFFLFNCFLLNAQQDYPIIVKLNKIHKNRVKLKISDENAAWNVYYVAKALNTFNYNILPHCTLGIERNYYTKKELKDGIIMLEKLKEISRLKKVSAIEMSMSKVMKFREDYEKRKNKNYEKTTEGIYNVIYFEWRKKNTTAMISALSIKEDIIAIKIDILSNNSCQCDGTGYNGANIRTGFMARSDLNYFYGIMDYFPFKVELLGNAEQWYLEYLKIEELHKKDETTIKKILSFY